MRKAGCGEYLRNIRGRGYCVDSTVKTGFIAEGPTLPHAAFLENTPIYLWTTDHELTITTYARSHQNRATMPAEAVIGRSLLELYQTIENGPEHPGITAHRRALAGETLFYVRYVREAIFHAKVAPLYDKTGAIIGCQGIALENLDLQLLRSP